MTISKSAIEAGARAIAEFDGSEWAALSDDDKDLYQIMTTAGIAGALPIIEARAKAEALGRIGKVFTALSTAAAEGHTYTIAQIHGYVLDAVNIDGGSK